MDKVLYAELCNRQLIVTVILLQIIVKHVVVSTKHGVALACQVIYFMMDYVLNVMKDTNKLIVFVFPFKNYQTGQLQEALQLFLQFQEQLLA
uniref:Uncharacterized protein n=1 Tax=Spironucleus salmonicida TaxID=348837 RepID=V6LBT4_9EUKA|eukprot:EST41907.1 Hypothetical protein SS50377_18210 [Spironucleus salmonicida]